MEKKNGVSAAGCSHISVQPCQWSIPVAAPGCGGYKRPGAVVGQPAFWAEVLLSENKMTFLLPVVSLLAVLSTGLCVEEKTVLQRAGTAFNYRQYKSMLSVTNGEQFGSWTWPEMCPDEFFAVGFSLRVKRHRLKLCLSCNSTGVQSVSSVQKCPMIPALLHSSVGSLSLLLQYFNKCLFYKKKNHIVGVRLEVWNFGSRKVNWFLTTVCLSIQDVMFKPKINGSSMEGPSNV